MKTLVYDGTFEGFLTAFEMSRYMYSSDIHFSKASDNQIPLFQETHKVITNRQSALKLWTTLQQGYPKSAKLIYFAFLSEEREIENTLSRYLLVLLHPNEKNSCLTPVFISIFRGPAPGRAFSRYKSVTRRCSSVNRAR